MVALVYFSKANETKKYYVSDVPSQVQCVGRAFPRISTATYLGLAIFFLS